MLDCGDKVVILIVNIFLNGESVIKIFNVNLEV